MTNFCLEQNSIPTPVELATKLRDTFKTRASDAANFLQQLFYWETKEEGFLHQGFRWIWNTYSGWLKNFPWWTEYDFRVIVKKLREMGLIEFKQLKDFGRDRTGCYRLNYEHEWLKGLQHHHPLNSSTDASVDCSTSATDDCSTDITKTTLDTTTQKKSSEKKLTEEKEEVLSSYEQRLKENAVYRYTRTESGLVPNPRFAPILRAVASVPAATAKQAIVFFLGECRTKLEGQMGDKYKRLAATIWNWGKC